MSENRIIAAFVEKFEKLIKLFNKSHIVYTIIFLITAIIIGICSSNTLLGNFSLFLATVVSLTFFILTIIAIFPAMERHLFAIEREGAKKYTFHLKKIIIFLLIFIICMIIIGIYFAIGSSTEITIQFLGWDVLLPVTFIIIYFEH